MGLHGRSALLRLQSDERLIAMTRKGNMGAFELLVGRYESRLLAFCRHLLGSREDAEDVLQEVMTAAYNAMMADDRPINVRPWLYRIARNRSLNHLRRTQAIGVDSMDIHLSEHGTTTADKVHGREEFRLLVVDIRGLPETQRTALVLREMDALSYEQIAEAMDTTVPSVKSLLVRARVSLAAAAEARLLSCDEVRTELAEIAEGLQKKANPLVRRHIKSCQRCETFQAHLKHNNKALAALLPIGPWVVLRKLAFIHLGHGAGTSAAGSGAAGSGAAGGGAAAGAAAAGGGVAFGGGAGGMFTAGMGAIATKAAAGLAAAALVTAGAVEVDHAAHHPAHVTTSALVLTPSASSGSRTSSNGYAAASVNTGASTAAAPLTTSSSKAVSKTTHGATSTKTAAKKVAVKVKSVPTATTPTVTTPAPVVTTTTPGTTTTPETTTTPGRTDTTPVSTVLPPAEAGTPAAASSPAPIETTTPAAGTNTTPAPTTGTPTSTTPSTTTPAPSTGTPISSTPTTTTTTPTTPTTTTTPGATPTPTPPVGIPAG